uniref:F-box domain-containing protein n=1 Tax=Caenorhabditis japonica TaxID=281687 RepID=A0A8R1I4Y5_CAEJA
MSSTINLFDLPIDVLLRIVDRLSLKDQILLASCNKSLFELVECLKREESMLTVLLEGSDLTLFLCGKEEMNIYTTININFRYHPYQSPPMRYVETNLFGKKFFINNSNEELMVKPCNLMSELAFIIMKIKRLLSPTKCAWIMDQHYFNLTKDIREKLNVKDSEIFDSIYSLDVRDSSTEET